LGCGASCVSVCACMCMYVRVCARVRVHVRSGWVAEQRLKDRGSARAKGPCPRRTRGSMQREGVVWGRAPVCEGEVVLESTGWFPQVAFRAPPVSCTRPRVPTLGFPAAWPPEELAVIVRPRVGLGFGVQSLGGAEHAPSGKAMSWNLEGGIKTVARTRTRLVDMLCLVAHCHRQGSCPQPLQAPLKEGPCCTASP
jgi:hypothetical protein